MTIIYLTLAWSCGLILGATSILHAPAPLLYLASLTSLILAIILRKKPSSRLILSCIALATLGILRMTTLTAPPGPQALYHLNGQGWKIVEGVIVAEPDVRDDHVNLRVRAETLHRFEQHTPLTGIILVQAPRYGGYAYGDRITAAGLTLTPPEFDDFSYREYLARRGILTWMPNAEIELLGSGYGNPIFAALLRLKNRAHTTITDAIPEPQASLLAGILLGIETGISPEVRDAFNATGTSHVIAISGFNMTLIAGLLSRLLSTIWPRHKRLTAGISIAAIGIYTVFVGANAAVVRAAIMSALLVIAPLFNRKTYVPASLASAALIMSAHDPFVLWDVGFQLSFAAVLGLALLVEPLERIFRRGLSRFFRTNTTEKLLRLLSEPLIVTLAAQITTTPLIALYFGRFSLNSLIVNFLILPVQTPILMLGGSATLLSLALPAIGQPIFWGAWVFLTWTTEVVRLFARLPGATVPMAVNGGIVAMFYAALVTVTMLNGTRPGWFKTLRGLGSQRTARLTLSATGSLAVIVLIMATVALPDGQLHVHFLDTGNSNAVLIETPQGLHILVDGGQYPTRLLTALGDLLPFWQRDIEVLILTQPKNAQVAALPAVLERYHIGQALTNGQPATAEDAQLLMERLVAEGVTTQAVFAGYTLETTDGVMVEVLHPAHEPEDGTHPNDAGLVLRLTYGEASFLLTPDFSPGAEATLLASGQWLHGAVLQLPNHGSDRVASQAFIQAVSPQAAVVQVATGNYQGYPAQDVIDRLDGIPLYRTDLQGRITITSNGTTIEIATQK